jgi:quercetin dioxygenase-like cupin family protein
MRRMPFVDVDALPIREPRPGWSGRFFHSEHLTFAYYAIEAGAEVHSHEHAQEETWHVLDGELEFTLSEVTRVLGPGQAVVVPAGETHRVRALAPSRAIVVDHPLRASVGDAATGAPGG